MTLPGILAYSSNVGTIKIADQLGAQKLYEYQQRFGLGQPTGEGVPGEVGRPGAAAGELERHVATARSRSGTASSATPLQMAAVYAAIANDGIWVQPHLVQGDDRRRTASGTPAPPPPTRQVLSPENAARAAHDAGGGR